MTSAVQARELDLVGYGGRPLPAVFWEPERGDGSAFVLPGGSRAGHRLGTTPARPDLHYTRALLLARGLVVLEVWWDAAGAPDGDEGEAWLVAQARAAAAAAPAPVRVAVARSWGTRALAKLVTAGEAPPTLVWIAPLLGHPEVRSAVAATAESSIVVAGTADALVAGDELRRLEAAGTAVVAVPDGNHALEVGPAAASARALADVLDRLDSFLAEQGVAATR